MRGWTRAQWAACTLFTATWLTLPIAAALVHR